VEDTEEEAMEEEVAMVGAEASTPPEEAVSLRSGQEIGSVTLAVGTTLPEE